MQTERDASVQLKAETLSCKMSKITKNSKNTGKRSELLNETTKNVGKKTKRPRPPDYTPDNERELVRLALEKQKIIEGGDSAFAKILKTETWSILTRAYNEHFCNEVVRISFLCLLLLQLIVFIFSNVQWTP